MSASGAPQTPFRRIVADFLAILDDYVGRRYAAARSPR